jgi:DNA modification methylase
MPVAPLMTANTLFYGDNLDILRQYVADESIDLVYLDPPFNANRKFNVLFKDERGQSSEAQLQAFEDTWRWDDQAARTYQHLVTESSIGELVGAIITLTKRGPMGAYLVMMAARLLELHRVLKPTGTLWLHCDPTASHYLKILLDRIFDPRRFLNEVTWKRSSAHSDTKQGMRRCGRIRDVLLAYAKSDDYTWNTQYMPYDAEYLEEEYRHVAPDGRRYKETDVTAAKPGGDTSYAWRVKRPIGRNIDWAADLDDEYLRPSAEWEYRAVPPYNGRYWAYSRDNMVEFARTGHLIHRETGMPRLVQYADEMPGVPLQDLWDDIPPIGAQAAERLGYPTQKPIALLERIINASSNPGDLVLDPFCGCGTTIAAAQKLGRRWLGIDITHLAIALQKYRLEAMFPGVAFQVRGEPEDLGAARQLAHDDRYQFQWWALSLVRARPLGGDGGREGKKGSDKGIDGVITFIDDGSQKPKRVLVQVKSGKVSSRDVRDLRGTVEREGGAIGVFITLEEPTRDMQQEAVSAGFYRSPGWGQDYPRIQVRTIAELLHGATIAMPPAYGTFRQAPRASEAPAAEQHGLDL